jgi:hypothetical protein
VKKKIFVFLAIICLALPVTSCFAETYRQKDSLFQIEVPEGWSCDEKADGLVEILNKDGLGAIAIKFQSLGEASDMTDEKKKEILKFTSTMTGSMLEGKGAVVTGEKETTIAGLYAYQTDFTYKDAQGNNKRTSTIYLIEKGYTFGIACDAQEQSTAWPEMENILETFKVL